MKRVFLPMMILLLLSACAGGPKRPSGGEQAFEIIAHRGVHTNWEKGAYDPVDGCEALHIYPPTVDYIENTLSSIGAAFAYGATVVEIDIRRTADGDLVIFHDDCLACRTDGTGRVEEHTTAYLQELDIGYGYTPDNGLTYPFRGKGIGLMPTLGEVLAAFPDRKFLIDQKDGSLETAALLVKIVNTLDTERQKLLYYWGSDRTYAYIKDNSPLRRLLFTRPQAKQWIISDSILLGIRSFPDEWSGQVMALPPRYRFLIRGWPGGAMKRNHEKGIRLFLLIDREEDAERFADAPMDGIITDYIEVVGPHFTGR